MLIAAADAFTYLSRQHGGGWLALWALLLMAGLKLIALAFRRRGSWLLSGIFAFATVVFWAVFLGALAEWFGWFPDTGDPFDGFHLGRLALEFLAVLGALAALGFFRFPWITLLVCLYGWFFVLDFLSGGGTWGAIVSLAVGVLFLGVAAALDGGDQRLYGFWVHVAAGLAAGGALLFFWHDKTWQWVLIAIASMFFVGLAAATRRSSWAVLGAIGLVETASFFAMRGANEGFESAPLDPFSLLYTLFEENEAHPWLPALVFAACGFLFVLLGLGLARGARTTAED